MLKKTCPYLCGFRKGKSTIDHTFTLQQILEKANDFNIITRHLPSIKFKTAYASINKD